MATVNNFTNFTSKFDKMEFPSTLRYTKDHEWVSIEGNIATVGITDFAQHELGDIVFVDVVSGTIIEVNDALGENPDSVNSDPYGKGWMVKMEMDNPAEFETLLDAAAYKQLIGA